MEAQQGEHVAGGAAAEINRKRDHLETIEQPCKEPAAKKARLEDEPDEGKPKRAKGIAPIKKEYLVEPGSGAAGKDDGGGNHDDDDDDDDAAESAGAQGNSGDGSRNRRDSRDQQRKGGGSGGRDRKKAKGQTGQNIMRSYGRHDDSLKLCSSVARSDEFSPKTCPFGERCNKCHIIRKYLSEGRRADVETFGGKCPVFEKCGRCPSGWRCRFVKSHSKEVKREDGEMELVLLTDEGARDKVVSPNDENEEQQPGVVNIIPFGEKVLLNRKKAAFPKADAVIKWDENQAQLVKKLRKAEREDPASVEDVRALFKDPPLKVSEKRRLYFGPETPALAPLTTQGNMPFRRLCAELGAQLTYSEMAMGLPLLQGSKADWALMKTHESELAPPKFNEPSPEDTASSKRYIVHDYDNSRDLKFGAQITATQPWVATKAAEALTRHLPHLRLIDLNCGCPIDMVYKAGGGSGLLDQPGKLERMIRSLNLVSREVPITVKLRTGIKEGKPTAQSLLERLAFGGRETRETLGAPGAAAVTLHGRSRQQRYTKIADWAYIAECAALVKRYRGERDEITDTIREPDESTLPAGKKELYFLGNGDCYSHTDYLSAIADSGVDTVMIGRGALIKPWLFEEIEKGQYLDKSASERLGYVEKFCRFGLECWGTDELGIGFTRRFLLEWLSFTNRYVPVGLLEYLPPSLNDRPPKYRGRNELEDLLASGNYKDWIKISEMFLGPAHPDFKFQPKHKSNSYENMEAEG
ncbi:tRNA-dihydrouridine(47) synthase [NAD(P)(+)] [Zalerion maritima]|uniref:tRNA-dihydrouridine(47) synthase [NAD(P)(+)] n=1 Tax=Zalerion maritima TaxID=339359 RepID=A0AAD5WPU3_9PEZI|nr:tRNA-dihydrouridine(47) synthase [NAD(P)(+)] [Zalerion maritima]